MDPDKFAGYVQKMVEGWQQFFWNAFTALKVNGISGDYVEFGSLSGTSMWLAYDEIVRADVPRHMWAFDSFEGLPETDDPRDEHPSFLRGGGGDGLHGFRTSLAGHGVPADAYTTVKGYYDETLPPLGTSEAPVDVALAYIDCNLYSSTVTVMDFLKPRLKHGMIVAMDDWFCWSRTGLSGERIALDEFEAANPQWRFARFKDISWSGLSFVVEAADG